jgi:hypothetical protein
MSMEISPESVLTTQSKQLNSQPHSITHSNIVANNILKTKNQMSNLTLFCQPHKTHTL